MKLSMGMLAALLLPCSLLQAQEKQPKERRFMVELSVGPSIPIGQFAEKKSEGINDETPPGQAKLGLGAQLTFGYRLSDNVGLLLLAGYHVYPQDKTNYENSLKAIFPNTSRITLDMGSWKVAKIMAGGFINTPLTFDEKLSLVTKLTAGVCKTAVPEVDWTVYDASGGSVNQAHVDKVPLSWSFCYQVNVGVQYKLNEALHLLFDVNSFNATIKNKESYYAGLPPTSGNTIERKYRLGNVNLMAGVGINF